MKILIVIGHPEKESYVKVLANAYKKGTETSGSEVRIIDISEYEFNTGAPFDFGNPEISDQINICQKYVLWADHIVWFFPLWWADVPARLKAFFENVFVSGFAFKYKESKYNVKWDKYLTDKTSRLFVTMDSPPWYYKYFVKEPVFKMMRYNLKFCGFRRVRRTYFGSVVVSDENKRKKWIRKAEQMGLKEGR